ncbi:MAG: hypothetical protein EP145_20550 [Bacteroides uniformis]|nr:hypothetical protein [Bacteroides uniformis]
MLGNLLVRNIRNLNNENTGLKHDEEEILGFLNIKGAGDGVHQALENGTRGGGDKTCLNY